MSSQSPSSQPVPPFNGVLNEQCQLLLSGIAALLLLESAAAITLVWAYWFTPIAHQPLFIWLGVIAVIQIARLLVLPYCRRRLDAQETMPFFRRILPRLALSTPPLPGLARPPFPPPSPPHTAWMRPAQIPECYPDPNDDQFLSAFAIYHPRYSTYTFPQWWLAQPFRMLAHNGEINTLKGNMNWMKSHEIRMASATFGEMAEDIKPIVASGSSDSAALDSVFEVLVRAGRSAPMAKTMLVPESWSKQAVELPQAWRDMYSYCNSVMEPWDGPAALAMTDGRWVCAGLDRNGLRPMRYVVTSDGMLVAGSEAGMVPLDEARVVTRGALGPGQMIAVDMDEGKLFHDTEIKDKLAANQPFGDWVSKIHELDDVLSAVTEKPMFEGNELRRRQVAAGYTIEELEQILAPMAEDGKETLASMGDDTPSAVLSGQYRPLSHFFRQNFSQVTNPPIDSLREFRVMSLKTRFGNLKNVLDEDSSQTEILVLDSPFVGNAQFEELVSQFNVHTVTIDCTFAPGSGNLGAALSRIRAEAEDAVRSGAGHLVLTDQFSDQGQDAIPIITATSPAHSHLRLLHTTDHAPEKRGRQPAGTRPHA